MSRFGPAMAFVLVASLSLRLSSPASSLKSGISLISVRTSAAPDCSSSECVASDARV